MSKPLSKTQPKTATEDASAVEERLPEPIPATDKPAESDDAGKFVDRAGAIWAKVQGAKDKAREVWLCDALVVMGLVRSHNSEEWCLWIRFKDPDGVQHEEHVSYEELTLEPRKAIARLARSGLKFNPRREAQELFCEYLRTVKTKKRWRSAFRVGWCERSYVFADDSITRKDDPVVYVGPDRADFRTKCAGTLAEWTTQVAQRCRGNSRLIILTCAAFASVLLKWLDEENAGFHLVGRTSDGKTTALIVAGSAWGGGHPMGFVRSWRTTENGCELFAIQHCDGLLVLDELAQIDPKHAATVVYTLLNGQAKNRMASDLRRMGADSWRVIVISSGEITLGEHMDSGGARIRGGQSVRMLDIPADAGKGMGVFEELHGTPTPADFAREISAAARRCYGTPIRQFLKLLLPDLDAKVGWCREWIEWFMSQLPAGLGSETARAARRFALLAAAGELATSFGITGWDEHEANDAARRCFDDWLSNRGTTGSSDDAAAVAQVMAFIEAHGASRFQSEDDRDSVSPRIIHNRAGFVRTNFKTRELEYLFLAETFRNEVCKGFDSQLALRALKERGLLRIQESGRLTVKRSVENMAKNQGYYAVVLDIE